MSEVVLVCPPQSGITLQLRIANGFWEKLRGLMWTSGPRPGEALMLRHCASVHTCFLFQALDLAYLDRDGVIVCLVPRVLPWRVSRCRDAVHTLELQHGAIAAFGLAVGQRILRNVEVGA